MEKHVFLLVKQWHILRIFWQFRLFFGVSTLKSYHFCHHQKVTTCLPMINYFQDHSKNPNSNGVQKWSSECIEIRDIYAITRCTGIKSLMSNSSLFRKRAKIWFKIIQHSNSQFRHYLNIYRSRTATTTKPSLLRFRLLCRSRSKS